MLYSMRTHVTLSVGLAITASFSFPFSVRAQQPALTQVQPDGGMQEPTTVDSEYRKFDGLLAQLRARNAEQFAISPKNGIDEATYVSIGGIEQWVTIRGEDRANPVLLFLHGGPGDVTSPWTFALFAPWEKHFTVVQWDQRGAGRTLGTRWHRSGGISAHTSSEGQDHRSRSFVRIDLRYADDFGKTGSLPCVRGHGSGRR